MPRLDPDPRTLQGQELRGGEILRCYTHLKPYCLCQTTSLFYPNLLTASPPSTSSSQVQGWMRPGGRGCQLRVLAVPQRLWGVHPPANCPCSVGTERRGYPFALGMTLNLRVSAEQKFLEGTPMSVVIHREGHGIFWLGGVESFCPLSSLVQPTPFSCHF